MSSRGDDRRRAFRSQRGNAKARGIEFCFGFDEWVAWWEGHLGADWINQRGCSRGKYVMARYGDKGPYRADNVKCVKREENERESRKRAGEQHRSAKLRRADVLEARRIYIPFDRVFGARALARKFGVETSTLTECLRGETWRHV